MVAVAKPGSKNNPAADRSSLFDERFLKTLEHLHMVSRKVFSGNLRAERRTRKVGSGIEFADHRTYARGDDFRYIDWNLYGRLDKLLLRLFEEEEDLHIYILVDCSDSMSIGTPLPKLHYAMQISAALTYVGLANLDRVSIIPFGDRILDRLPLSRGKNRIFRVFDFLQKCQIGGQTQIADCMKDFVTQNKRRGLAVVISDFYDPKGFEQALNTLRYYKFEPFVLEVYDLREASPKLHGDLTLVDCETGDTREVTVSKSLLEAYEKEFEKYQQELSSYCTKYAIPFFRTHTAIPFDELVLKIFRSGGFLLVSFLGPITGSLMAYFAVAAALLAVGAYIIKMRRRRFEVPWVQLWKRVLEQKDANALWKQLKRLISLLLILLILGLVLFAALDPTLGVSDRKARSVVVLIDASASMKTMDGNEAGTQSRMDVAKEKADGLIDSMGGGDVAMIVKVDGQATPMSRFTNDKAILHKLINGVGGDKQNNLLLDGITASDTPADLTRALGAAADALRDRKNPLVVLVSDGAFPETQLGHVEWQQATPGSGGAPKNLAAVDLSGIDVRYMPVGHRSDNVGIISFNVRRYIDNKASYEVFVEIQNFGTTPAKRKLLIQNGSNPVDQRDIELKPGERIRRVYQKLPASDDNKLQAVLRHVDGPGGSDAFPLDDFAYALLPIAKKQNVLMVTEENLFLRGALLVYDNVNPMQITPAEYNANPRLADGMDVVVFDDFTPEVLPPPPTSLLYFHPTGEHSPFKIAGELSNPRITEIDEDHPVMRWVTLSDVYSDKSNTFTLDNKLGESAVAYSVRDVVIAAKRDGRRKILAFGFSLPASDRESATDLPMRVAFPIMLVNTLDWFAGDQADLLTTYATGRRERIPLDGATNAVVADVKAPDGTVTRTPVLDGLATFYGNRVGYYEVTALDDKNKPVASISLAANLASTQESDIAPSAKLSLGGKALQAPEAFAISRSQKLWWYFIAIAMLLIVTEWITYHRRITV